MQKFEITKEQLEAVFNYLVQRPYREVAQIVDSLKTVVPITAGSAAADGKPVNL